MTLGGRAFVRIDVNGIVRARLHASLTANAALGTEVDDPVFPLVHRGNGTNRHARRVLAVIAAGHLKHAPGIGKRPLLHVLHPGAVHGERDMVFRLARDRAGVAANALAIVDDEPVFHPNFLQARKLIPRGLGIVADCQSKTSDSLEALRSTNSASPGTSVAQDFRFQQYCQPS